MPQSIVAGNWKMNGSLLGARALARAIADACPEHIKDRADVIVCPPNVFLESVVREIEGSAVMLGAQNCSEHAAGAYTGEVDGDMLSDLDVTYVIVGHSERRAMFDESNERVAAKFVRAKACGLVPILCVGESLEDREAGTTMDVVKAQLSAVVDACGMAAFAGAIVAYEPVWAIGTGKTASPEQAEAVHAAIRRLLAERDSEIAAATSILYGGSVKGSNADSMFAMANIDGGLIGGAALDAEEFLRIVEAAS
jgi:triosephosphate isomerase